MKMDNEEVIDHWHQQTEEHQEEQDVEDVEEDDDDHSPEFFEPEDLIQLGTSAIDGAKTVAGAVGSGLKTVKKKWVEHHQAGGRVVGAGWSALTCTVGRGWNTLSEAADFWVKDINDAEAEFYMEEEATANRLKMEQAAAAATKRANDITAATLVDTDASNGLSEQGTCAISIKHSANDSPIRVQMSTNSHLVSTSSSSPTDVASLITRKHLEQPLSETDRKINVVGENKQPSSLISCPTTIKPNDQNDSEEEGIESLDHFCSENTIKDDTTSQHEDTLSSIPLQIPSSSQPSLLTSSCSDSPMKESKSWVDLPAMNQEEEEWEYIEE